MTTNKHTAYDIILKNVGHATIWEVTVRIGDFTTHQGGQGPRSGGIGSGRLKIFGFVPFSLPPEVTATWRTEDGTLREQIVHITPDLLPRAGDYIVFNFHDSGVVTVERFAESDHEKAMKLKVE